MGVFDSDEYIEHGLHEREARTWKSAWRWMLVVTVLSNAGWAWAWWVYR